MPSPSNTWYLFVRSAVEGLGFRVFGYEVRVQDSRSRV